MSNLEIVLKDCYGIGSMNHSFDMSDSSHLVYAHNGVMKTSLAKTFDDVSKGLDPKELVYGKTPECLINWDGNEIDPKSICVVESETKFFESDLMSKLLVDPTIKSDYMGILKEIDNSKDTLISSLRKQIGYRSEEKVIKQFLDAFNEEQSNFLHLLESKYEDVRELKFQYDFVDYKVVFDEKVLKLLTNEEFSDLLLEYINMYDKLVKETLFLKEEFNHNNFEAVLKALKDNKYFEVDNTIILRDKSGNKKEISSIQELKNLLDEEMNEIYQDKQLKEKFQKINSQLKQKQYKDFRQLLLGCDDPAPLIQKLHNINLFKKEMLLSLLKESWNLYDEFVGAFVTAKKDVSEIIELAKDQQTQWDDIVDEFNDRFTVPFTLEIKNKEEVILGEAEAPHLVFNYQDREDPIDIEDLLEVLSSGEKRALYVLNILFEIEGRKELDIESLIILDDIADSFDYANKYAIIEYLYDITDGYENIHTIILTHNFDFFRTVHSRVLGSSYQQAWMAVRDDKGEVKLEQADYFDAFKKFKQENHKCKRKFVATIPFTRELVKHNTESCADHYTLLSTALHIKPLSNGITVEDIKSVFGEYFSPDIQLLDIFNPSENITEFILSVADEVVDSPSDGINLEDRIVLAIAIRLVAEKYMIHKIKKVDKGYDIANESGAPTRKLFEKYKSIYEEKKELKKVLLYTPEAIHLNSFMYEPLIDIGMDDLINLYREVKSL